MKVWEQNGRYTVFYLCLLWCETFKLATLLIRSSLRSEYQGENAIKPLFSHAMTVLDPKKALHASIFPNHYSIQRILRSCQLDQSSQCEDELGQRKVFSDPGRFVSIVMASYNRLPLLTESVMSALAQDYPNFEVLLVDDGSDEETKTWIKQTALCSDRFRAIFQDHQGVAVARACGVEEACGGLICILDSDDTLEPCALQRLVSEIELEPPATFVYSNIRELRPNGLNKVHEYPDFSTAAKMLWATLLYPRVPFKHSGTVFRRHAAQALGSYDQKLPCKVDIDLFLKFLSAGYKPRLIEEPLVNFRMHRDSISRNRVLGLRVWFQLIDRYAPAGAVVRLLLKGSRTVSETFKWLYMAFTG